MTQTTLWLLPLALGSLFGMVGAMKRSWRWSWGIIIQHGIVLAIALCGLFILPSWDWLCAYAGWAFMLTYTVVARILLAKMIQALGLLRTDQAISIARFLRLLHWGPPGRFWLDLAYMINFYLKHDTVQSESIYKKWQNFGLPRSFADSLTAYAMVGLLVMRDWKSTAEKYEQMHRRYEAELVSSKRKETRFPFQTAVPAARALNELGKYKEASQALALADLPGSGYNRDSLETVFLSYFAMLGAVSEFNYVLAQMKGNRSALPQHARLYWQARCLAQSGDPESACLKFRESLAATPAKDKAWRQRTEQQLQLTQEKMLPGFTAEPEPDKEREKGEAIDSVKQIMKRCFVVANIMSSRKPSVAVRILTGCISVMFFSSYYPAVSGGNVNFVFGFGYLAGGLVFAGQWWRLVTYVFLHGGISHLAMNLFGLVWFGRFVENIYGTWRFLLIFFLSGVLSGALQIFMSAADDKAVGASGAILGIFGAGLAATLRLKNILPASIRRHELSWMIALAATQLVFDQVVNFLFPAVGAGHNAIRIAAAAHFGGMVSGFALGWILPLSKLSTDDKS